jgi:predicted DNA-binding transcriptional regulator AlpA
MARVSPGTERRPAGPDAVQVVSLIEVFDIFSAHMRKGVADLIERGDFAQPYQELIGFTVWDRNEVERWITNHPEVVQRLETLAR